jgi:acylpyruvate hydrolase
MRLVTLSLHGTTGAALIVSDGRARVFGSAAGPSYADVGAIISSGALDEAGALQAQAGEEISYTEADLLAPVLNPGAVFCVGLNYRTHILEMGRELPQAPTIFDKLPRALTSPYAQLDIPKIAGSQLDYEGELCVVIGAGGRNIAVEDAAAAVAGYAVLNDITMRDYQTRSLQWLAGKSWQDATPWGPALVTSDELGDFERQPLRVTVNGEVRQEAEVGDLVFDVAHLIADLSTIMELQPGDLIATGTPGGVGHAMDPKGYLADGDVVEVSIGGIGTLRNTIRIQ